MNLSLFSAAPHIKTGHPRPLPSCPSMSDLERIVDETRKSHTYYDKNLKEEADYNKSPIKELSLGWTEPKIAEMLQSNKQFKSQGVQAGAQTAICWTSPHKIDLDTVDGVGHNLTSNIGYKNTPIKHSTRYVWGEHLKGQSPRSVSSLKCSQFTRDLLQKSKKKIMRLVSPKKHNRDIKMTTKRTVGVQTADENAIEYIDKSPPGSYHSPINISTTTPTTTNNSQDIQFDFSRTVQSCAKLTRNQYENSIFLSINPNQ